MDELERDAAARRVAGLGIDARREEQGILAARIELERATQPADEARVVERCRSKTGGTASPRRAAASRLAEGREAQRLRARRRRQLARRRVSGVAQRRLPGDLRGEASRRAGRAPSAAPRPAGARRASNASPVEVEEARGGEQRRVERARCRAPRRRCPPPAARTAATRCASRPRAAAARRRRHRPRTREPCPPRDGSASGAAAMRLDRAIERASRYRPGVAAIAGTNWPSVMAKKSAAAATSATSQASERPQSATAAGAAQTSSGSAKASARPRRRQRSRASARDNAWCATAAATA